MLASCPDVEVCKMSEKIAIVTGANKGLGFAVVKALCQKYNGLVYLTARNESEGLEAVKKMNIIGLDPQFHLLDVSDKNSVKTFAEFIKEKHGGIDVLVNNSGIIEWDQIYPTHESAKRNIDVNYKSLLIVEEYLYPLLRDGARVVNVTSACGHLSNLKNQLWLKTFLKPDLTVVEIDDIVNEYLDSVRNGTFDKNNFANDGKHAEHLISNIAITALTMVQQRKYNKRNISINAVNPGWVNTDKAQGAGDLIEPDKAAEVILYLVLEASSKLKGTFMWHNKKLIDWYDAESDFACNDLWY